MPDVVRLNVLEGEDTGRIDALSDGVFAIVLTLLVLQFEVPDVPQSRVWAALLAMRPLLFSYLLSFVVVGLYWVVHHNLFQTIVRYDRPLLYLNLLFLLFVSFLPFPTELLGTYGTRPIWILYAIDLSMVGLLMTALWWYAFRRGFVHETIGERTARLIALRGVIGPAVFLLSIGVSFVSLDLAYVTPLLIGPLNVWWLRAYQNSTEDPRRV